MSALPAEVTELPATPVAVPPVDHVAAPARVARTTPTLVAVPLAMPAPFAIPQPTIDAPPRVETRASHALVRRVRRRWSIFGLAILACSFGLTVGVLDVLH
jgi:hypothetical protein